jgi:hypothetical protein
MYNSEQGLKRDKLNVSSYGKTVKDLGNING